MDYSSFDARSEFGEKFAAAVFNQLQRFVDHISRHGGELSVLARFLASIRQSSSPMELRVRFAPDGQLYTIKGGLCWWEAKASRYIQKEPFLHYRKLEQAGEPVVMFLCPDLGREDGWYRDVYVGRFAGLKTTGKSRAGYFEKDGFFYPEGRGSHTPCREVLLGHSRVLRLTAARMSKGLCEFLPELFIGDTLTRI